MNYECWVPLIKDVVLAIAGVIGSVVAILGLGTWKRQLYGQSEYELAKRLLKSLYLFREVINNARHPFMQYSAVPDLPQDKLEQLSNEEKEWHAQAQAWEKMWEPVAKARADLDTNVLESEVFWGDEIKDKMAKISRLQAELLVAIQEHIERTNPRDPDKTYIGEDSRRVRAIMYGIGDRSKDAFLDRLLTAIEEIENTLKPYIRKGRTSKKKAV
jgi:hypothetical protein